MDDEKSCFSIVGAEVVCGMICQLAGGADGQTFAQLPVRDSTNLSLRINGLLPVRTLKVTVL